MTREPLARPLLLLISGASGSGKTTLATRLVESVGLFHVNRDRLKYGIEYTTKTPPEQRLEVVIPRYFDAIEELLKLQVSCIADGTHFPGDIEKRIARYKHIATIINVHCSTSSPSARKEQWREDLRKRVEDDSEQLVEYEPGYFPALKKATEDPTARPVDHGFPVFEVNTDKGYEPGLEEVVAWINSQAR